VVVLESVRRAGGVLVEPAELGPGTWHFHSLNVAARRINVPRYQNR